MADFERIDTRADLDTLAQDLMGEKVLAIDTEADSFYHYFDKTCLVQIATRRQIYLIDPLAFGGPGELSPLGPIMASPDIRKIFHAAEYDIFVLKRDCSFQFQNLFDTMICAQILGYPSVGLASLAERHFGVNLPKDEQRSDWSRRPLTPKQMSYAASDVLYLIPLAELLEKELRAAKRLRWAREDFEVLAGLRRPREECAATRLEAAMQLDQLGQRRRVGDLASVRRTRLFALRVRRAATACGVALAAGPGSIGIRHPQQTAHDAEDGKDD